MAELKELPRSAQLVALTHFLTGAHNEVTFSARRMSQLHPTHKEGLDLLEENGMVEVKRSARATTYTSTAAIGYPIGELAKYEEGESYPMFVEPKGDNHVAGN